MAQEAAALGVVQRLPELRGDWAQRGDHVAPVVAIFGCLADQPAQATQPLVQAHLPKEGLRQIGQYRMAGVIAVCLGQQRAARQRQQRAAVPLVLEGEGHVVHG